MLHVVEVLQGVSQVQGWVQPDDSLLTEYWKHSSSWFALKYIPSYLCVPSYTGAVVLGFLEPENKPFIDDEVRTLLGMVACWLPAASQPEGGCPSVLMSCALFLFLT